MVRPLNSGVDALTLQGADVHWRAGQQAGGNRYTDEDAQEEFPVVGDALKYELKGRQWTHSDSMPDTTLPPLQECRELRSRPKYSLDSVLSRGLRTNGTRNFPNSAHFASHPDLLGFGRIGASHEIAVKRFDLKSAEFQQMLHLIAIDPPQS